MISIQRVPVDEGVVGAFEIQDQHAELAFDLLKETGQYVTSVAGLVPVKMGGWERNEAILCGHMVRLGKLLIGLTSELSQGHHELTSLYVRLSGECIVNLLYLIRSDSEEVYESFVRYSLRHEKSLLERIDTNIASRTDGEWAIEQRMRRSILASFKAAGVQPDEIDSTERGNWGGDSIYHRCKKAGYGGLYFAIFAGGSHSIHGNWQDLYSLHLSRRSDGLFEPSLEWGGVRPQTPNLVSRLVVEAVRGYLRYLIPDLADEMDPVLNDLFDRIHLADYLHEEFLIARRAA